MATRIQKIKVGIFLFISVVFLVVILILISGMHRYQTAVYYVNFNESVTGLDKGGEVRYSGVLVGQVKEINIGTKGTVHVVLEIRKDKLPDIKEGMVARLAIRGITGIAYVELSGGAYGKVLPLGSPIPAERSFISNITTNFPEILEKLNDILGKTNKALGESENKFESKIDNFFTQINDTSQAMTTFVNEATTQTKFVSKNLVTLITDLERNIDSLTRQIDSSLKNFDRTVNMANLRMSQLDVVNTQKKIQQSVDHITTTTLVLENFLNKTNQNMENVEYNLVRSLRQLHSTLDVAETLLRTLERDPSALLYGYRPPED